MFLRCHNYATVTILAFAAFLYGCTTSVNKEFSVTGSNKNSGIIELSFDHGVKEKAIVDDKQPDQLALERCQMWGYNQAQQTQVTQTDCVSVQNSKCMRTRVTILYQCK